MVNPNEKWIKLLVEAPESIMYDNCLLVEGYNDRKKYINNF